ncbi:hypothetical protein [Nonomuraea sp. NPDC050202]|uniref:hypothetical protein n=1 Tax=Nonomuraea sp. NPDC050202 TaxID=3155035 RepID=UPI0033E4B127
MSRMPRISSSYVTGPRTAAGARPRADHRLRHHLGGDPAPGVQDDQRAPLTWRAR